MPGLSNIRPVRAWIWPTVLTPPHSWLATKHVIISPDLVPWPCSIEDATSQPQTHQLQAICDCKDSISLSVYIHVYLFMCLCISSGNLISGFYRIIFPNLTLWFTMRWKNCSMTLYGNSLDILLSMLMFSFRDAQLSVCDAQFTTICCVFQQMLSECV